MSSCAQNISDLSLTFAEGVACESHELLGVGVDGHERETLRYVLPAVVVEIGHPANYFELIKNTCTQNWRLPLYLTFHNHFSVHTLPVAGLAEVDGHVERLEGHKVLEWVVLSYTESTTEAHLAVIKNTTKRCSDEIHYFSMPDL